MQCGFQCSMYIVDRVIQHGFKEEDVMFEVSLKGKEIYW